MLQYAHAGSAHGNNSFGFIDRPGGGFRQEKMLRVHLMVLNIVRLDGTERAHAHVKRQKIMRYGGKQFRCKVQTGRRGGNGPLIPGVYRLVTFLVRRIALPVHVMGKRQPSVLFLVHFPVKPDQAVSFRIDSLHHSYGFSDGNGASHLHFAPRTHHALPQKGIEHLGPDNLNGTVIGKIPGGDHPGIIEDEMVSRPYVLRQIAEMPVFHQTRIPVEHQHP